MYNENTVLFIGNVGKVEIKTTNGTKFAVLSLATNERWTDKTTGEIKERTDWHRCSTFRPKLVSLIEKHIEKGDFLRITGKLRSGSYQANGETVWTYETEINRIGFLSPKSGTPADDDGDE